MICPASLKINWHQELSKWLTKDYTIGIVNADCPWPNAEICICNYDILVQPCPMCRGKKPEQKKVCRTCSGTGSYVKFPQLYNQTWDIIIADEAQRIKGHKNKSTKAFLTLNAKRKIALTGTPIMNRPIEIQTTLQWLDKSTWGNRWTFGTRYCNLIRTRFGMDWSGASNLGELQERLRGSLLIRRLKADVLTELPPKFRQVIELPSEGMEKLIEEEWNAYRKYESVLQNLKVAYQLAKAAETDDEYHKAVSNLRAGQNAAFTEMALVRKQVALTKLPYVVQHIRENAEPEHKIVCMAWHHEVVDKLVEAFTPNCTDITGKTPVDQRQGRVNAFQTDPQCYIFLGNMKAAGVGITLTASSHVIFAELDWTPSTISQCEDRCLVENSLVFCLPSVHNIPMSIKFIQDIKAGDIVLTHLGNARKVTAVKERNHRGLITNIKYMGWWEPLECTHDHKVFIKRDNQLQWIEAHQLLPSDSMAFPKIKSWQRLNTVMIKPEWRIYQLYDRKCTIDGCNKPSEARQMCRIHYRTWLKKHRINRTKPRIYTNGRYVRLPNRIQITDAWLYLFGWYCAEGFSSVKDDKGKFISLSGHQDERNILIKNAKIFDALGIKWSIYKKKDTNGIELRAYCKELALWFKDWFGHRAKNKKLPTEILNLPPRQARVFLKGYTDGDGYSRKNQVEWVSASKTLCYQMCILAIRSGFIPTMRQGSTSSGSHYIGGYTKLGKPDNQRTQDQDANYVYRPIRSVETRYAKLPVYDLTVEDDHSFTTGFASVHNCHRIGQTGNVLVQHLVLEGSLDSVMAKRIIEKQKMIAKALDLENTDVKEEFDLVVDDVSTASTTRKEVAEKSVTIKQEDIAIIHGALRFLSALCDGARSIDGMGFSKLDAEIGHSLARHGSLTQKQAYLGRKLCIRHKRQLPEEIRNRLGEMKCI